MTELSAFDIAFIRDKRRLRASWQAIAVMMGRSEPDIRRRYEEAQAPDLPAASEAAVSCDARECPVSPVRSVEVAPPPAVTPPAPLTFDCDARQARFLRAVDMAVARVGATGALQAVDAARATIRALGGGVRGMRLLEAIGRTLVSLGESEGGAVLQLVAEELGGEDWGLEKIRRAVAAEHRLVAIVDEVGRENGFSPEEIRGRGMGRNLVDARHEAILRCREQTRCSLPEIGRFFGGRDHATVLHGIRRATARRKEVRRVAAA